MYSHLEEPYNLHITVMEFRSLLIYSKPRPGLVILELVDTINATRLDLEAEWVKPVWLEGT